jgi:hypothetical protein
MEEHRTNPACQGCHRLMDPIGFALESFDAIGRYRELDNGAVIDPTGNMYDGFEIRETSDLVDFLVSYQSSFYRNVTQKMLTYALGRGMEFEDMPLVRQVQRQAEEGDYRFHALVKAVVSSDAFLKNAKVVKVDVALVGDQLH